MRSLHGAGRIRVAGDGIWWTTRTPEGPATLHVTLGPPIRTRAWGPGAEIVTARAPGLLGLDDDSRDYVPGHPSLREAWRRHPGLAIGRTGAVIEALLPAIVAQKVPGMDAARSWRALARACGEAAPGPAPLALSPDPARLAELSYHDLHRFGIDRKRAEPLLAACRVARRLERLADRGAESLMAGLCQLRGIGPWTATTVARAVFGDPDIVVVGDYGLPSMVTWNLAGERRGDDRRMLELLDDERPHRARAMQLILAFGQTPPRHGPRLRPTAMVSL